MTTVKLAFRNLLGAGMKTWLRVAVLSLAFVVIIGLQGLYEGMSHQATQAMLAAEIGGGQYWHEKYDPQNPLDLPDAHGVIPSELDALVDNGGATPILAVQGFVYSAGGFRPVLLKGIEPSQRVLSLPTAVLDGNGRRGAGTHRHAHGAGRRPEGRATPQPSAGGMHAGPSTPRKSASSRS